MNVFYKFILGAFVVALFAWLLIFLSSDGITVLDPKGLIALVEKNLLITATLLMMIVIIPVFIMLFAFAWRYRAGNTKAKYSPEWAHNTPLELVWWTIPIIIIAILGTITWNSTHALDPYKPLVSNVKPMTIQVVALDWKWLFIYPEQNIATVNVIAIPIDVPIRFEITADAPMNSFWIPSLGGQIYAMAGMNTQLNLIANKVGDYPGASANFSGAGFSGMKFVTQARIQSEFDEWVIKVKESPNALTQEEYNRLAIASENNPATFYSTATGGLFESIMMKFMAPQKNMDTTTHGMMKQ